MPRSVAALALTAGMQSDAYNALIHQITALKDKYEQRKLLERW